MECGALEGGASLFDDPGGTRPSFMQIETNTQKTKECVKQLGLRHAYDVVVTSMSSTGDSNTLLIDQRAHLGLV